MDYPNPLIDFEDSDFDGWEGIILYRSCAFSPTNFHSGEATEAYKCGRISEVWSGEARDISVNDSVWGLEERGTQRERVQNVQGGESQQGVMYIR